MRLAVAGRLAVARPIPTYRRRSVVRQWTHWPTLRRGAPSSAGDPPATVGPVAWVHDSARLTSRAAVVSLRAAVSENRRIP
jgi:hypothetical protein